MGLDIAVRWLGHSWIILLGISVVLSVCGMMLTEPTLYLGWQRVTETFSPFNLTNTAVMVVLALPSLVLYRLSDFLKIRASSPASADIAARSSAVRSPRSRDSM